MAGSATDYLETRFLDHALGITSFTAPTPYLALFTVAPTDAGGGTEATGGSYARVALTGKFSAAASAASANTAEIAFAALTADIGTAVAMAVMDASSGGNMLIWGTLTNNRQLVNGSVQKFPIGTLTFTLTGMETVLANEMLDHILGVGSYTMPVPYIGLLTASAEVSGGGYTRIAAAGKFTAAENDSSRSNTAVIQFPTATGSLGTVTRGGIYDASSSGNALILATLTTARTIDTGAVPTFYVGEMTFTFD